MKNFVIDYHGGSGGDFLRICLWLMLHPEYLDIEFVVDENNVTMVRILDQNNIYRHVCSIDQNGKVSPGIANSDVLFDPIRDALRYHCYMKDADNTKISPIQESVLLSNTKEEFKINYKKQIQNEIENQAKRNWDSRTPESDHNICIGHDIFWCDGNINVLNIRDEILNELLHAPAHRIGLLADTPLSFAIVILLSYKKGVLPPGMYNMDDANHITNIKLKMFSHKNYKFFAGENTTIISVTDLLDSDLLFDMLNKKITRITKTILYEKFYNKYMTINKMDEVVKEAIEFKKHFDI